jgi:predicted ATPase
VAAELIEQFDYGIWFVELAPLADPDLIPQAILSAMGVKDQSGKDPLELLKTYLQEKQSLIVLDNCEHLISASAQVVNALLRAAPRIKVMASSREALGVRGEVSYPVPSLTLPNIKHLPTIEGLSQYEAVRLFIDRALLVSPRFVVDKDNAPYLAQICHRLDGIPLAIELAAARIKVLTVEQISNRLDDRFRLLTGGARTALPRQQTLRALIDWSYDLLNTAERLFLQRLSVFAGGWTLESTEAVCAGDEIDSLEVLDLLSQLVNKSLVVVMENSKSGETRYRMLETIRQYARDKLLETGGGDSVRDKHLAYFVQLAQQAEPELYRPDQLRWLLRLDDEFDNLRLALEWSLSSDPGAGLRLLTALKSYWDVRSFDRELIEWLPSLLDLYSGVDSLRSYGLLLYSSALQSQGNLTQAYTQADQSLQLSRTLADKHAEANSLMGLGYVAYGQGDFHRSLSFAEQSVTLFQTVDDPFGRVQAAFFLNFYRVNLGRKDIEQVNAYSKENLRLYRELGHLAGIANTLVLLAHQTILTGDYVSPPQWLEEALAIYRDLKNPPWWEAFALQVHGVLAHWTGNYQQACEYYEESRIAYEKFGDRLNTLWSQNHMAHTLLQMGDVSRAKELFEHLIQQFQKIGQSSGVIFAIEGLAGVNISQRQFERAVPLYAWTDAFREKVGNTRPPVEQRSVEKDLATIHAQVDDATYNKLWSEGSKLTIDEAIALALKETTS